MRQSLTVPLLSILLFVVAGAAGGFAVGHVIYEPSVRSYSNQVSKLSVMVSNEEVQIETFQSKLNDLKAEILALQNQLENEKTKTSSLETSFSEAQRKLTGYEAQIAILENDLAQKDNVIAELNAKLANDQKLRRPYLELYNRIAPQNRPAIHVSGYIPTGMYELNLTSSSAFVSFPYPRKCFEIAQAAGTGSMRPFFDEGAQFIVNNCFTSTDIQIGDIVEFRSPRDSSVFVVHQVIDMKSGGVVTKGFNVDRDDGLIPWGNIVGIVVAVVY